MHPRNRVGMVVVAALSTSLGCGGYLTRAGDTARAEQDKEVAGKVDIVPGSGIGGVTFGMTAMQVSALLGDPDETAAVSEGAIYGLYHAKGLSILFKVGKATVIQAYSGRGIAVHQRFRPYVGSMKEGVTVKSTRSELVAKLGKPVKEGEGAMYFGTAAGGVVRVNFVAGGSAEIESIELWEAGMEI
jgi:hypothetical protein